MKKYPDNFFDLAIVDPPYGIDAPNMSMGANIKKNKSNTSDSVANRLKKARFSKGSGKLKNRALNSMRLDWDIKPKKAYFDELFRVSKNQIIFGGNYFNLPPTRCVICWDKVQPWQNFSQWEMAWTSFDKVASIFKCSNKGGNISELKIHPTQKPVKLYEWILMKYAQAGDKILDTHLGSGSNRIACYKNGFDFYGFEIDKTYYDAQNKRFENIRHSLDQFRNFTEETKVVNKQLHLL
ncbi:site-specific DNA-methyltransferase [Aurantibacter aestuarii]|uniref:Methyltransferase n=2 Tax=Aurantibacter aestuarii TaxID=1266046 RepID=A0A2T1NES0_9FLAO|nr:site-specific DNA-methyltransferase [Aurantibacter aestuarii]